MTNPLCRALEKTSTLIGQYVDDYQRQFQKIQQMPGGDSIIRRIADSRDEKQLKDYLTEVRYALVFAALQFQINIEPFEKKGPDLKISKNGNSAIVEIARFRKINPGPPMLNELLDENLELMEYGDIKRDIRKCYEKICSKFRQIEHREIKAIIAIWNDDEALEDIECMEAVRRVQRDYDSGNIPIPHNLSFILYGSYWIGIRTKQLHCFPTGHQEPFMLEWQNDIQSSVVSNLMRQIIE